MPLHCFYKGRPALIVGYCPKGNKIRAILLVGNGLKEVHLAAIKFKGTQVVPFARPSA